MMLITCQSALIYLNWGIRSPFQHETGYVFIAIMFKHRYNFSQAYQWIGLKLEKSLYYKFQ